MNSPTNVTVRCVQTGRFLDEDWRDGQLYDVEPDKAARLLALVNQSGSTVGPVFVLPTDEPEVESDAPPSEAPKGLAGMRLEELRALAKARNVADYKELTSAQLIQALSYVPRDEEVVVEIPRDGKMHKIDVVVGADGARDVYVDGKLDEHSTPQNESNDPPSSTGGEGTQEPPAGGEATTGTDNDAPPAAT